MSQPRLPSPALPVPNPSAPAPERLPPRLLEAEARFYQEYAWCLNPCLTVREAASRLGDELARLDTIREDWQRHEVLTNAYLLACAMLNSVDDYLRGPVFELPRQAARVPFSRFALKAFEKWHFWRRSRGCRVAAAWRESAAAALDTLLRHAVGALTSREAQPAGAARALGETLKMALPEPLLAEYTAIPSAFRKQDLTPFDVLTLGRRFIAEFPDRREPVLVVGLRTAGSYFAPLVRALLHTSGYETVDAVTLRPGRGLGVRERSEIGRCARAGYRAALFDDPPFSGDTIAQAADLLYRAGFPADRVTALFPVHPLRRGWRTHREAASLARVHTLDLEPELWEKVRLLEPAAVEARLADYFRDRGYRSVRVVSSAAADGLNAQIERGVEEKRRNRLKRVYEVSLETADGRVERRLVLAKSVGWGYLSYHAFLAASRLAEFVPPLLGLRDGFVYLEWLPRPAAAPTTAADRERWIRTIGSYTAARTRHLGLPEDMTSRFGMNKQHDAFELLGKILGKAYGHPVISGLMAVRLRRRLAASPCPSPTLIDAKMRPAEWLDNGAALLKTDFEHHGLGKNELNVVDPAYDLAETVLQLGLTRLEEDRLLARYRAEAGDAGVADRLFLYKLLAGLWAMTEASRKLGERNLAHRQQEFHRDFVRSWDFLTVQSARHCGARCARPAEPAWRAPLLVLDVDGVIDRRLFGFPCTSAAGVQALALAHAHGLAVALNTARPAAEVKEYCAAYGCAGAVAEYGSYFWDAVRGRGQVLVSAEAMRQLSLARDALRILPGVFVNEGYEYSIRACSYEEGRPVPLPTPLVHRVLAEEGLDKVSLHQTTIDSTLTACDVDKGTGLSALLAAVGLPAAEAVAVGDSEPDLAMFRVAGRCFGPANLSCGRLARFFRCTISPHAFQSGLLHIVRSVLHPDGGSCPRCVSSPAPWQPGEDLFLDLLTVADEKRSRLLARGLAHPSAFGVFVRST